VGRPPGDSLPLSHFQEGEQKYSQVQRERPMVHLPHIGGELLLPIQEAPGRLAFSLDNTICHN
jgi:hypothetical protein